MCGEFRLRHCAFTVIHGNVLNCLINNNYVDELFGLDYLVCAKEIFVINVI